MATRLDRTAGQDITRPAIRATDFDELVREGPGVAAGEGIGFGDGSMSAFQRPRVQLRREVRAVEQCDRKTRRGLTPFHGIEAHGDVLPRAHRRTPFPESELTLARPERTPEQPARTEVMEEREEH